jgi:hypothetical protein
MHSLAILYTLGWHYSSVHKFASKEKLLHTEKTSLEELLLQFMTEWFRPIEWVHSFHEFEFIKSEGILGFVFSVFAIISTAVPLPKNHCNSVGKLLIQNVDSCNLTFESSFRNVFLKFERLFVLSLFNKLTSSPTNWSLHITKNETRFEDMSTHFHLYCSER